MKLNSKFMDDENLVKHHTCLEDDPLTAPDVQTVWFTF
jgi:hypothetical protein